METGPSDPGGNPQPGRPSLPMRAPEVSGIQLCPVCHGKMRQTAEICPHCGAEKHFGATPWEAVRFTLGGLVIGILFTIVTRAGWAVGAVAILACVTIAFIVCQSRYGHRWMKRP